MDPPRGAGCPAWAVLPAWNVEARQKFCCTNMHCEMAFQVASKPKAHPVPVLLCHCFACPAPAACPACVLVPHLYLQLEVGGAAPCHKLRLKHSHNPLGVGCCIQELAACCNSFKHPDCCAWQCRHIWHDTCQPEWLCHWQSHSHSLRQLLGFRDTPCRLAGCQLPA